MKAYLLRHGIEEGSVYTHGSFGGGDVDGIERIDGVWHTYFSERGNKNSYRSWPDEASAVVYILPRTVALAKQYGMWRD